MCFLESQQVFQSSSIPINNKSSMSRTPRILRALKSPKIKVNDTSAMMISSKVTIREMPPVHVSPPARHPKNLPDPDFHQSPPRNTAPS